MAVVGNWTYSGDPSTSDRDAVRFLIRDTDEASAKVSDEEIAYLLAQGGDVYWAAISAAEFVATTFSNQARTKTVGALSITYEASASEYRLLARDLRLRRIRMGGFIPYSGGISISDKRTNVLDSDRTKPAFSRGMHDNPNGPADERLSPPSS